MTGAGHAPDVRDDFGPEILLPFVSWLDLVARQCWAVLGKH
jgi:hypothetical protein